MPFKRKQEALKCIFITEHFKNNLKIVACIRRSHKSGFDNTKPAHAAVLPLSFDWIEIALNNRTNLYAHAQARRQAQQNYASLPEKIMHVDCFKCILQPTFMQPTSLKQEIGEWSKYIPARFNFLLVESGSVMSGESNPDWFPWGSTWAVGQMTQPIVHYIFVSSLRRATTPQPVTPQACCDICHWNSVPLSAGALSRRTTHQNSPLHLCSEVSVKDSDRRVHILLNQTNPGLASEKRLAQVLNHLMAWTKATL